jgi:hypothetical protein
VGKLSELVKWNLSKKGLGLALFLYIHKIPLSGKGFRRRETIFAFI